MFEALEHYLTGPAWFDPAHVVFRPGAELAAGALAGEACGPVRATTPQVACLPYTPLRNPTIRGAPGPMASVAPLMVPLAPLMVPLALGTSWYLDHPQLRRAASDDTDYRALTRYGTNNGSAIGATLAEALLHGLNEIIERDALSLLLARCFLATHTEHHQLRVVDPASLPPQLAAAYHTAREVIGAPVWLLHATTDLRVPTYFAYTTNCVYSEGRFGGGTSLHPHYAAWRALSELVQMRLAANAHPELVHPTSLTALAPYPKLRAAGEADLTEHLRQAEHIDFPAADADIDRTPGHVEAGVEAGVKGDVEAQPRTVIYRMTAAGYPPYKRVVAELDQGVVAVRVFAPAWNAS